MAGKYPHYLKNRKCGRNRKSRRNHCYLWWCYGSSWRSWYRGSYRKSTKKYQKRIIDLCRQSGKFVIVATHMLESMIEHPFPNSSRGIRHLPSRSPMSRCNDALGETTTEKYPIESVDMMRSVIQEAEEELEHKHHEYSNTNLSNLRYIEKISHPMSTPDCSKELRSNESSFLRNLVDSLDWLLPTDPISISVYFLCGNKYDWIYAGTLWNRSPSSLWVGRSYYQYRKCSQKLLKEGIITRESRVIAITDLIKNNLEVPAMEIITVGDFI